MDIYRTKRAEDADFSEEQLVEISYQVLQALAALNRSGGLHCKSMLHFDSIYFDENGMLKLQEMSHVFFDQYKLKEEDLIFMPPEVLTCGKLSERGDVWTLGMLILLCMSPEFDLEGRTSAQCSLKGMLDTF